MMFSCRVKGFPAHVSKVAGSSGIGGFCSTPTPEVQLDHFLLHTPKLGIHVEMVQFLKLLLKRFLLCTTISIDFNKQASFHLC